MKEAIGQFMDKFRDISEQYLSQIRSLSMGLLLGGLSSLFLIYRPHMIFTYKNASQIPQRFFQLKNPRLKGILQNHIIDSGSAQEFLFYHTPTLKIWNRFSKKNKNLEADDFIKFRMAGIGSINSEGIKRIENLMIRKAKIEIIGRDKDNNIVEAILFARGRIFEKNINFWLLEMSYAEKRLLSDADLAIFSQKKLEDLNEKISKIQKKEKWLSFLKLKQLFFKK
ncbi:unnamed protein product [Blepharisma stoltei]|uniref:Uncharacterized protein n=1 Tax=Blepharisma stoltei TaxID=1481888 RepID=A0AAU9JIK6_9CILI|nr:unnamed protein product [Blepharisma stoltei]